MKKKHIYNGKVYLLLNKAILGLLAVLVLTCHFQLLSGQVTAFAGADTSICQGDTLVLSGSCAGVGCNVVWQPHPDLADPALPTTQAYPQVTTQFILAASNGQGDEDRDTLTVVVHPQPVAEAGPDLEICPGDNTQLQGMASGDSTTSFYGFFWTPGIGLSAQTASNPLASPVQTTWYGLTVTSSWGCNSPVDSVRVTVRPHAIPDAGPNLEYCTGDSVKLLGSYSWGGGDSLDPAQLSWNWSPATGLSGAADLQPMAAPSQGTWYHLAVTSPVCGTLEDSVLVSVVTTPDPVIQQVGNSMLVSNQNSLWDYQWVHADTLLPGANGPVLLTSQPGCYRVEAQLGGCIGISDTLCSTQTGLADGQWPEALAVYPIPLGDRLYLHWPGERPQWLQVDLRDVQGQVCYQTDVRWRGSGELQLPFAVDRLPAGVYWLTVQAGDRKLSRLVSRVGGGN